ncbi:hypothetical protein DACRYDRAFT_106990 [Dacryopinax primogenitus]|uniref:Uncharacterized protein n=1 Tax=Dacryopinax primogenitus (strain DJM 731) TaxID=1858805 RepID=M5GAD3_DACPD|nr:uncharacterized protein DACRYDRAFT_106990 [Dacryopinax primogenitus]EJU02907.1 hypothetical protein DACRYDRAFT_106990 [Dacryopinax primogenitus]
MLIDELDEDVVREGISMVESVVSPSSDLVVGDLVKAPSNVLTTPLMLGKLVVANDWTLEVSVQCASLGKAKEPNPPRKHATNAHLNVIITCVDKLKAAARE